MEGSQNHLKEFLVTFTRRKKALAFTFRDPEDTIRHKVLRKRVEREDA